MTILRKPAWTGFAFLLLFPLFAAASDKTCWHEALAAEIAAIDNAFAGRIGVYVRHLGDGKTVHHRTDRDWYLASTIKIPLSIALMQRVEQGELSLDDELELAGSDFIDGSGELLWHEPGMRFSLEELDRRSIRDSDSTATDMLIRHLGEESLNRQVREAMVSEGLGPITTILQVRYDAYGEIHPRVSDLSNRDFIEIRAAGDLQARYRRLLEKLTIEADEARVRTTAEAFERYYTRGLNSGSLEAVGQLLERLARGELLNDAHTRKLLDNMEHITTGDRRIRAGLPEGVRFAHKTGTQIARACDIGILNPGHARAAVIVAACAEGFGQLEQAEQAFAELGRALADVGLATPEKTK